VSWIEKRKTAVLLLVALSLRRYVSIALIPMYSEPLSYFSSHIFFFLSFLFFKKSLSLLFILLLSAVLYPYYAKDII